MLPGRAARKRRDATRDDREPEPEERDVAVRAVEATPAGAPEFSGSVAAGVRLAVAPTTGRFRPAVQPGDTVEAGALLGWTTGGRGRADDVRAPSGGVVRALLVRSGQLVQARRALLWIDEST
jgi:biotin carboxyl carrier protein